MLLMLHPSSHLVKHPKSEQRASFLQTSLPKRRSVSSCPSPSFPDCLLLGFKDDMKLKGRWLFFFFKSACPSPLSCTFSLLSIFAWPLCYLSKPPILFHITSLHHFLTTTPGFSSLKYHFLTVFCFHFPVCCCFLFHDTCPLKLMKKVCDMASAFFLSVQRKNVGEEIQSKQFTPGGQDSVLSRRHQCNDSHWCHLLSW